MDCTNDNSWIHLAEFTRAGNTEVYTTGPYHQYKSPLPVSIHGIIGGRTADFYECCLSQSPGVIPS